ncbi:MAG TPA: 5-(carboxyamino)imidazole ribonucleotide synthase [Steroidobacteraceae bacterium]
MRLSRVGIVGAGQLGRMLALAGYPLGMHCLFLDRSAKAPAAQVAPILTAELEDPTQLATLAGCSDVLTFDWENISAGALAPLEKLTKVRPPRAALEVSQDRLSEKALFEKLRIPVAAHAAVDSELELARAVKKLGAGVLKTRRLGYDGKGQFILREASQIGEAWAAIGGRDLIYEKFQDFSREVSIIGARSATGRMVFYPLAANSHGGGILHYNVAPFANARLERSARTYLKRLMNALDYVGVLTVEFFVVKGRLVANEMAPRVHNSGHWTIEGCVTSQFENHLRAICDLPLGSTRPLGHAAMINFLGEMPDRERLLAIDGLAFHDYGKEPRPGRKLGHCTILKRRAAERNSALAAALESIQWT